MLPANLGTSDHASWAVGDSVYIAGGYQPNYVAHTSVARLSQDSSNTLTIEQKAPLLESRGDIKAVTDGTVAYVSGGFTDTNGYCPSLDTVEKYTVATNTWEALPPLMTGRGDKALAILDGRLYALGGENQVQGNCGSNPLPGEQTVVVDDVEVFEDGKWVVEASVPERRFRFEAVAVEEKGKIYTFGGQQAFNATCSCYRTTDEILYLVDAHDDSGSGSSAWSFAPGMMASLGAAVIAVSMFF